MTDGRLRVIGYVRVSTAGALLKGWVTSNEVAQPSSGGAQIGPTWTAGVSQVGSQVMGQNSITDTGRETA